jgi:hypothetical protein
VQPAWIEFHYWPGMVVQDSIRGTITSGGIVHAVAYPQDGGREVQFERQLRPEDIGRLREAIERYRAKYPSPLEVRMGITDSAEISIDVDQAGERVISLQLFAPCNEPSDEELLSLWNEIMRAVRSPDHDALDHAIHCR